MNKFPGVVTRSTGSWYTVRGDDGRVHECRIMGAFRIKGVNTKNTNPVAVGDKVEVEMQKDGTGYIVELHDRRNYIIRRSAKISKQTHILAANIDHAWVMATLHSPRTSLGFIDRFLVTAEAYGIPASIIFNKCDLMDDEEKEYLSALEKLYTSLGYGVMIMSALDVKDVKKIGKAMAGKVNLIAGHSGTGKSTLINSIEPSLQLRTGELSRAHNKGMHTTTFAEMLIVGKDTYIIDTPGIKELGIVDMEKNELGHFFPEMRAMLGECKYHGCLHDAEPGCAVRQAVEESRIALTRYECYLQILKGEELEKEYDD
jgi:ribosome biogenesis GTPase